jgi:hypothetical protein
MKSCFMSKSYGVSGARPAWRQARPSERGSILSDYECGFTTPFGHSSLDDSIKVTFVSWAFSMTALALELASTYLGYSKTVKKSEPSYVDSSTTIPCSKAEYLTRPQPWHLPNSTIPEALCAGPPLPVTTNSQSVGRSGRFTSSGNSTIWVGCTWNPVKPASRKTRSACSVMTMSLNSVAEKSATSREVTSRKSPVTRRPARWCPGSLGQVMDSHSFWIAPSTKLRLLPTCNL